MSISNEKKPRFLGFEVNNTIVVILFFFSLNGIISQIGPLCELFIGLLQFGLFTLYLINFLVSFIISIIYIYIIFWAISLKKTLQEDQNLKVKWLGFGLTKTSLIILFIFSLINVIIYTVPFFILILFLISYIIPPLGYIGIEITYTIVVILLLIILNGYTLRVCLINRETYR